MKRWTDYLPEVLERTNTGKQSDRVDDDKVYPHAATGFPPEEAAKPENWFRVHNNLEIQAKHKKVP